jgi:hypothetical protein
MNARQTEEVHLEKERMHDVLLLVGNLIRREEATVKMIVDCLYDVGSVNLINQKFHVRPLNRLMQWVARLSKPAFRFFALRWIKRNAPRLATNWLYRKVKFDRPRPKVVASQAIKAQTSSQVILENPSREIRRLHSQIRLLTALLIGTTFTLGGVIVWSVWSGTGQVQSLQPANRMRTATGETMTPVDPGYATVENQVPR